jgi:inner membrane protein
VCTVITHPAVPLALSVFLPAEIATPPLIFAGALCSIVPDLDVITFDFGIEYRSMFGHRGFTHSILFAIVWAAIISLIFFRRGEGNILVVFLFLLLSTLSHPFLDALTNGGLGVAFFAPFSNQRHFFPWRPIAVSPIGFGFFSSRGVAVLWSEIKWVWAPSSLVFCLGLALRRLRYHV